MVKDSIKLRTFNNLSFTRIKHDFKYGKPNNSPTLFDTEELYSMLTLYPHEMAKDMFTANVMISYMNQIKRISEFNCAKSSDVNKINFKWIENIFFEYPFIIKSNGSKLTNVKVRL